MALALLLALPGAALASPGTREIVGGQPVPVSAAPWQIALVDSTHYGSPEQFCGGSILDARHVVTAAHCLKSPATWSADHVYAGTTTLYDPKQVAAVCARSPCTRSPTRASRACTPRSRRPRCASS